MRAYLSPTRITINEKPSSYHLGYYPILWRLWVSSQETCYVPGNIELHGQVVLGKEKWQYHHICNPYVWTISFLMDLLFTIMRWFFPFLCSLRRKAHTKTLLFSTQRTNLFIHTRATIQELLILDIYFTCQKNLLPLLPPSLETSQSNNQLCKKQCI